MKTISMANHKGGCAKTTTGLNVAVTLANTGSKVLAVDLDPQGNLSASLGLDLQELEETRKTAHRLMRVHWVAIAPCAQGRGLAKPLMTNICRRLRDLGHQRAYLTTAPERIVAINLYLKFGFVPVFKGETERAVWQEIQREIERRV